MRAIQGARILEGDWGGGEREKGEKGEKSSNNT